MANVAFSPVENTEKVQNQYSENFSNDTYFFVHKTFTLQIAAEYCIRESDQVP